MSKTVEITKEDCVIEKFTIFSPSMGRDIRVIVVLPPAYEQQPPQQFAILHTLHGYSAPYDTFAQMEPLRKAIGDKPMIVTCLDGDRGSFYVDSPINPQSQFNTFFFEEFVPYLDDHYRVDAGRRAVTGFSMGGFGAFQYMTTRPEMFNSISSLSGAFYHLDDPVLVKRGRVVDILGKYAENKAHYDFYDPYLRIDKLLSDGKTLPPMFLHCGQSDSLVDTNREMTAFLKERGCEIDYQETAGDHDWPFWRDASVGIVDFHWKCFNR